MRRYTGLGWLGAVASSLVVLATAALLVIHYVGPEHLGILSLVEYVPYPLLLLPFVVVLPLSFAAGRMWAALTAVALLTIITSVMDLELQRPGGHQPTARVLTFNVKDYITRRSSDGMSGIAREIARHDPDIFVLQDARSIRDDRGVVDPLVALLASRHTYSFGQYVISSRTPLEECRNGWISFRDEPHSYAQCTTQLLGRKVGVITAHFITPRVGLSAARLGSMDAFQDWAENASDRMTQARALAADLQRSPLPMIVSGDFNAPPSSLVLRTLTDAGLIDAFEHGGSGYGYTWGHSLRFGLPFVRIDHILVSREFGVNRSYVGDAAGSAHRPVVADLYLNDSTS